MFHAEIQYDFNALKKESSAYKPLPESKVDEKVIRETYLRIKREVKGLKEDEMDRIMNTPGMQGMVARKKE